MSPPGADARVLDPADPADRELLERLRADPAVEVVDLLAPQRAELRDLRPGPDPELLDEPSRWVHYPWRRSVVRVLGRRGFQRLRLDRNRNKVTAAEQQTLSGYRIGVIGLSVGHAIAHTLAMEGACGELRLADFDSIELSNLNRVPATVFDIGVNKAVAVARRIAELDPYLRVTVVAAGLTDDTVDEFFEGLDLVVEECDSLDMKLLARTAARSRRIPLLMETNDRGLLDVERYDLEPDLPPFHGLLGDVDSAQLGRLSSKDKVPFVLRILDPTALSPRAAASLVEIGQTLSTWPQLGGDVALGASTVVAAARRIALGHPLPSGRVRIDVEAALDTLGGDAAGAAPPAPERPASSAHSSAPPDPIAQVLAAAIRAPSGGNSQPWRIHADARALTIRLDHSRTSRMDVGFRGSAVAIGAASYNARVAAAALGILGRESVVSAELPDAGPELSAVLEFGDGSDLELARLYPAVLDRQTNRRLGSVDTIDAATRAALHETARREGGGLRLLDARADIEGAADLLAASDRVRFLTPDLHREMISELRWPGEPMPDTGIDVHSLELDSTDLVLLDVIRRPEVMAHLADWQAGSALGESTRLQVRSSSALTVVTIDGSSLADYVRAGAAVEAVWVAAQQHGLAVHPVSPVFLYASTPAEFEGLSAPFAQTLAGLHREFRALAGVDAGESIGLILRLSRAPVASVRSRRLPTHDARSSSHAPQS